MHLLNQVYDLSITVQSTYIHLTLAESQRDCSKKCESLSLMQKSCHVHPDRCRVQGSFRPVHPLGGDMHRVSG